MEQAKWLIQLAGTALAVIALLDQGRKKGWI
jgi:hypothetical protein